MPWKRVLRLKHRYPPLILILVLVLIVNLAPPPIQDPGLPG